MSSEKDKGCESEDTTLDDDPAGAARKEEYDEDGDTTAVVDFSQEDSSCEESEEKSELSHQQPKNRITIKTVDDRGQEVEIEFENINSDSEEQEDVTVYHNEEYAERSVEHLSEASEEHTDDAHDDSREGEELDKENQTFIDIEKYHADGKLVVMNSDVQAVSLVYVCSFKYCMARFISKEKYAQHIETVHQKTEDVNIGDNCEESNLVISEENSSDCMNSELRTDHVVEMDQQETESLKQARKVRPETVRPKLFTCPKCHSLFHNKGSLVNHLNCCQQALNASIYRCYNCSFKTKNHQALKKHATTCISKKTPDIYSVKSVDPAQKYRCVCTWCEYKSNRYSNVKKHIEIYHQQAAHYPCKECVFVGKTVDDYATHFNSFHKTDDYKHACTDCSFKCTNRQDMRNHYIEAHRKQRLYACKLCMYRAQDVMTIKKHISKAHSTYIFQCKSCNFSTNKKYEFSRHCTQVHGESGLRLSVLGNTIGQEVQEIIEKVVPEQEEAVDSQDVMEEQIFEEEILEEQIEEEVISDFYEGDVMIL